MRTKAAGQSTAPSTVFGLAAYNGEDHLAEALESLLGQTRDDLLIVVVDDCSTDDTREIARRYTELDSRIVYERNDCQLGLVRNWRRAFDLAAELAPDAIYFAWASDHDVWHPRWLESLAAELEAHPEAAFAYPQAIRIDDHGSEYPTRTRHFDTAGITSPARRVRLTAGELTFAGEIVYGLGRRSALERCGAFPLAVLPDRLHLVRLAVEGEFRQVPRRLWYRRYRAGVVMSNTRQRRALFPGGVPAWTYLPWWLTHACLFHRSLGDRRHPGLARAVLRESVRYAYDRRRERARRERRWRRRRLSRHYRGLAQTSLERIGLRRPRPRVQPPPDAEACPELPPAGDVLVALERAELLAELADPSAVVVEIAGGTGGLCDELANRVPGLRCEVVPPDQLGAAGLERIVLAVGIASLGSLRQTELEAFVERLRELRVPALYALERESAELRAALGGAYWLRDVWVPSSRRGERKPDPAVGPVPRPPGSYRHLVGRLRLTPSD